MIDFDDWCFYDHFCMCVYNKRILIHHTLSSGQKSIKKYNSEEKYSDEKRNYSGSSPSEIMLVSRKSGQRGGKKLKTTSNLEKSINNITTTRIISSTGEHSFLLLDTKFFILLNFFVSNFCLN